MQFDPAGAEDPSSELALGTHNRVVTAIESPGGRGKTPAPPPPAGQRSVVRRSDSPEDYLDAVLGSYRVIELLGKGGMGYVYRAEHVKLGREVALKLLRSDYASRRDAVARFFQEARTVNRVRHRNIVDVTDFVELDDGTTYIIMELLTGTSLGSWARSGIDLPRAVAVLIQICDGLAAAHEVGVVHRDLKPDNVIVVPTSDGAELVKLLDFGVAKLLNRDDEDVGFQTAAGSVIGTPAYMSPEQAGGMVIDARSDIYSLGAIMYELFTGQPMFRGRSFGEYVRKHLTENPTPPHETPGGASLSPELEALIMRCLEKDADQRFAHISELRDALLELFGSVDSHPTSGSHASTLRGIQLPQNSMTPMAYASLAGYPSHASHASHASGRLAQLSGAQPAQGSQISGSSQVSQLSGGYQVHPGFDSHHSYAPPAAGRAVPWWVWGIGGAVAIGLGIGGAIWYAERADPTLAPGPVPAGPVAASAGPVAGPTPPQPSTAMPPAAPGPGSAATGAAHPAAGAAPAPGQPPAPASQRPALIEVRFDSAPSGGVLLAQGRDAELCRTPCTFNIDVADGGPADARAFVVKHDGYADGAITVDLTSNKREYSVALQPATLATEHPTGHVAEHPTEHVAEHPTEHVAEHGHPHAEPGVAHDPKRTGKHPGKLAAHKDPARAHDDEPTITDDPDSSAAKPAAGPAAKPATKPSDKPTGKPSIDPSDTLDPFHH